MSESSARPSLLCEFLGILFRQRMRDVARCWCSELGGMLAQECSFY